jgi:hypothetical protein
MHVTQSGKLRKIRSECEADGVSMVALNVLVVMNFVFYLEPHSYLTWMK